MSITRSLYQDTIGVFDVVCLGEGRIRFTIDGGVQVARHEFVLQMDIGTLPDLLRAYPGFFRLMRDVNTWPEVARDHPDVAALAADELIWTDALKKYPEIKLLMNYYCPQNENFSEAYKFLCDYEDLGH